MRKQITVVIIIVVSFASITFIAKGFDKKEDGYILEHEKDIAAEQPGPHNGKGITTAYSFFSKANGFKLAFRKRVLHPGSSIGYHLQEEDEVYYVISGSGEMTMNGKSFTVTTGDAILTRPGSYHGLVNNTNSDLAIIINYEQK